MGELPLSTLSIPSWAPPPNKAVMIFNPTEMMFAHGDGATPLSKSSDFGGAMADWVFAPLKNICMTMPVSESRKKRKKNVKNRYDEKI